MRPKSRKPLVVDLDGTLFVGDSGWENLRIVMLRQPGKLAELFFLLVRGRAAIKCWLYRQVGRDRVQPMLRQEACAILRRETKQGRTVHLLSGAPQELVTATARRLGLSPAVGHWGSQPGNNLTFAKKPFLLKRFGAAGYDYWGDRNVDIPIFQTADRGAVVGARPAVIRQALRANPKLAVIAPRPSLLAAAWQGLRPHQWVKNLLLLVPLFSAHAWDQPVRWGLALGALAVFSFLSSAVYLLNDIHDLEADRAHPSKSDRPLASGALNLPEACGLVGLLLAGSLSGAWWLGPGFFLCAAAYLMAALGYNAWAKKKAGLDLIGLASFYTLRIFAGGAATGIDCSPWLVGFAVFLFLSLASVKRVSELLRLKAPKQTKVRGRGYGVGDEEAMAIIGIASGVVSVLVAALYINSTEVTILYSRPPILWFLCPIILYWVMRVWLKTLRGQMPEDPILFALKDRVSWLLLGLAILVGVVASR